MSSLFIDIKYQTEYFFLNFSKDEEKLLQYITENAYPVSAKYNSIYEHIIIL